MKSIRNVFASLFAFLYLTSALEEDKSAYGGGLRSVDNSMKPLDSSTYEYSGYLPEYGYVGEDDGLDGRRLGFWSSFVNMLHKLPHPHHHDGGGGGSGGGGGGGSGGGGGGGYDDDGVNVDELNNMDDYQPWISNDNLNYTITSQGGWFSSRSGIRGDGSSSSTSAFVSTTLVIVGIAVAFVAGVLYGKKGKSNNETEDGAVKRRNESFKSFLKNKLKRKEAHDDGTFQSRDRGESGIQFVSM